MDNQKVVLLSYPEGLPEAEHFELQTEPAREPAEGEVMVAVECLSIDAWIRTTLSPGWAHQMIDLGNTVPALGVGRVLQSNCEGFAEGDAVFGPLSAQSHATLPGAACQKVDDQLAPLSAYLGLLSSTTGLTAYFGIRDICQIKDGETVVVSAAAGAVGSAAGQMARIEGAGKVIGIAGGPDKVKFLTEKMGFDAGIDYKNEDIDARLKELAPEGVDVFFDNVGGEMLDTVLDNIRDRARVCICGAISQYDDNNNVYGPKLYLRLAERYSRMEGFTVMHFAERYCEGMQEIAGWMQAGKIGLHEQYEEGLGSFPGALKMLFTGGNTGKLLVRVAG